MVAMDTTVGRAVLDRIDESVIVVDEDFEILYANQTAAANSNRAPTEVVGEYCYTVTHDRDSPCEYGDEECPVLAAEETTGPITTEHEHYGPDGRPKMVELTAFPIQTETGSVAVAEVASDVTTSRSFEQAVEQAGLAVFVTDADGIIEYVNPAFEKITGYDRSDVIGRTPGLLDADDDDPTFDADLLKTVFDGESWQGETTHYRQSGEEYHASLTVTPITDRNGHVVRLVAIQEDITEKKHSKRHLKVLNRFLRHNHRNLLNLLVGTAQSLERRDEGTVRMLEQTSSELDELSEKAYAITEVLLEEKDEQRIDDLRSLVEGIATEYAGKFPKTTIDITGKTPAALSVHPQISRALREVIENAIVHSGSAPGVDIHLRSDGDHSAVSITDDGPGIHPEEYEVITGESEITQINHASGLGLWLVYWIVQRSGGDIEFESSESGSTVTIRLPHWKEA